MATRRRLAALALPLAASAGLLAGCAGGDGIAVDAAPTTAAAPGATGVPPAGAPVTSDPLPGAAQTELSGSAAAQIHALLGAADDGPVRIAFVGSSTTAGAGASSQDARAVDRLVAELQARFTGGAGGRAVLASSSGSWGELSPANGIHGYNAGVGGARSADYLEEGRLAAVASLAPGVVVHMVGANDYGRQLDPAEYGRNLTAALDDLDAASAAPVLHVLVHQHQRLDTYPARHPWAAYGRAVAEVAAARPDRVLDIDVSGTFEAQGTLAGDPDGLIDPDRIHLTDAGHRLLARELLRQLLLPPPSG